MDKRDDVRHVSLNRAAAVLAEAHPEYAFTARELREMCDGCVVPCMILQGKGLVRKARYFVSVEKLVKFFKSKENRFCC